MDYKEILIIGLMRVLYDSLEMLCPWRYGVQTGIEPREVLLPLLKLALRAVAELGAVIQSNAERASDVMGPEPEQHEGQKYGGKDRTEFMSVCGKEDARRHVNDVPLKQGELGALYMGIDFSG